MENNTLQIEMLPQTIMEKIAREFASDGVLFHPEDDTGIAGFVEAATMPNSWMKQFMLRKAIEVRTERENQKAGWFSWVLSGIAKLKKLNR